MPKHVAIVWPWESVLGHFAYAIWNHSYIASFTLENLELRGIWWVDQIRLKSHSDRILSFAYIKLFTNCSNADPRMPLFVRQESLSCSFSGGWQPTLSNIHETHCCLRVCLCACTCTCFCGCVCLHALSCACSCCEVCAILWAGTKASLAAIDPMSPRMAL